ncbi:hypothetical protein FRC12_018162 [Ceratobasidium sp. 428]|nr:hypothetical protein FRC12_018162 [Ceratobasidium sp. 428]
MTSDSVSNATVNEHGRPQTLSVPPDGADEGEDGYGENSGDNDYGEPMDIDDEENESQCMPEASYIILHAHNSSFITALTGVNPWSYPSVALTSIGQHERRHASPDPSGFARLPPSNYPPGEAAVSVNWSRQQQQQQQWYPAEGMSTEPAQVPYISSVMSPYAHPHVPSRVMPPLSEVDRRLLPTVEKSSTPRPKPYVCDRCDAAFSRAHDLKRHIETHKVSLVFLLLPRTEADERRAT